MLKNFALRYFQRISYTCSFIYNRYYAKILGYFRNYFHNNKQTYLKKMFPHIYTYTYKNLRKYKSLDFFWKNCNIYKVSNSNTFGYNI